MLLAACHGSCSKFCSVSLQWIQRSLYYYDHDPPNTYNITPIDWHGWCVAIDASCYSILVLISRQKNTRKRPKHFAIYLDKTQLIPACRVWENGCWLMFRVIKKLGQCLTGQPPSGLHHQDKNDQRMCLVNSCAKYLRRVFARLKEIQG